MDASLDASLKPDGASRLPAAALDALESTFPRQLIAVAGGARVAIRSHGPARANTGELPPLVCLHGIGSGSASWLGLAGALPGDVGLLAWDAPGYGESTPLPMPHPTAGDYAVRLRATLDALALERCILVGHSLGALMATPAAIDDDRVAALVLISPAQGYGSPDKVERREKVRRERLDSLDREGIAGLAAGRSPRLVSTGASDLARAWVHWNMARLNDGGYRQAIELLCGGDLLADVGRLADRRLADRLPAGRLPIVVACGEADVVTPPDGCETVARRCGVALQRLPGLGHACYVEGPEPVAAMLMTALQR